MATHAVMSVTSVAAMRALLPEWLRLFYASGTPNPFAHPLWLMTWARHFISPDQLYLATVRTQAGALVGVAPLYQRTQRPAPGLAVRRLQMLGAGRHELLTEVPQVLFAPGSARAGLRDLLRFLSARDEAWDCVELTLAPDQGWFEHQWLPQVGPGAGCALFHQATRPCVVAPLPATVEEWQAGLKRNVKESIRRGANRLARAGHSWEVVTPCDAEALKPALDDLVALHRARAALQDTASHPDYLSDPADRAFLYDVAHEMFHAGHLTPYRLLVDGQAVAARLLLHANGGTFFSVSGVDPAWQPYNVATTLHVECLRRAIARGDHLANLSVGPDVAKLRWSEQLQLYQDIVLVGPRRRSRLVLGLLWQGRSAARLWRQPRRRNAPRGSEAIPQETTVAHPAVRAAVSSRGNEEAHIGAR
jgi:CelD/BcsL family acetyltransferase involved in cellulose biosynthesis